jgi:hypothetical protein
MDFLTNSRSYWWFDKNADHQHFVTAEGFYARLDRVAWKSPQEYQD